MEGWVKTDGYTVECYIPKLTQEEEKVIAILLMDQFADKEVYQRNGDIISFDCTNAGSAADELVAGVENMFWGFLFTRHLYKSLGRVIDIAELVRAIKSEDTEYYVGGLEAEVQRTVKLVKQVLSQGRG